MRRAGVELVIVRAPTRRAERSLSAVAPRERARLRATPSAYRRGRRANDTFKRKLARPQRNAVFDDSGAGGRAIRCARSRAGRSFASSTSRATRPSTRCSYNARDLDERYSARTPSASRATSTSPPARELLSSEGAPLLTIVADTCGRHDTLGGACSTESNTVRYALDKKYMHACRDSFLLALARTGRGMSKRDLPSNINFFMNVPVTPDGKLTFDDGISGRGATSRCAPRWTCWSSSRNCPQLNNPCNAYNPTPIRRPDLERGASSDRVSQGPRSPTAARSPAASCARCGAMGIALGRGLLRGRRARAARAWRRRGGAHRPGAGGRRATSTSTRILDAAQRDRRRGHPSRLRLSRARTPTSPRRCEAAGIAFIGPTPAADARLRPQAHGARARRRRAACRCCRAPGCLPIVDAGAATRPSASAIR